MENAVTQKQFYEAIQKVTKETSDLTIAMTETKTLIRDYNGLRKTINDVDDRVQRLENSDYNGLRQIINSIDKRLQTLEDNQKSKKSYREYIAWLVTLTSTLLAIYMAIR